ncbi:MAG: hypothetical protein AAF081_19275 [Actinomycetota bacterium]
MILIAIGAVGFFLPSLQGFPVFAVSGALFCALGAVFAISYATEWRAIHAVYRQQLWSTPRDAPSPSRVCSVCAAPLQSSTWASGGAAGGALAPLDLDGERCDRCGGPTSPATRRAELRAQRDALVKEYNEG